MRAAKLAVAFAAVLLASVGELHAATLFAIQERDIIAESLHYGPVALTESDSAFLSTLYGSQSQDVWTQIAKDGNGNQLYEIRWEFATTKTLAQRFQDAVTVGEPVTWIVNGTDVYTGTWRFSDGAGDMLTRFSGSGTFFSNDDGAWGAGNGVINGNGDFSSQMAWGYGNFNGGDGFSASGLNGTLRLNNVTQSTMPTGFKNFMYIGDFSLTSAPNSPAPEPSTLALLGIGSLVTANLAARRRRSKHAIRS